MKLKEYVRKLNALARDAADGNPDVLILIDGIEHEPYSFDLENDGTRIIVQVTAL